LFKYIHSQRVFHNYVYFDTGFLTRNRLTNQDFSTSRRKLMNRPAYRVFYTRTFVIVSLCALVAAAAMFAAPRSKAMLATLTVNTTADTVDATPGDGSCADSGGQCSLRAAIMEANATSGADTITLPAGTYTLTLGPADDEEGFDGARDDIGDLDILNSDLTINGAGAATTTITAAGLDRVIEVNDFAGAGVGLNVTISGVTITGGTAHTGTFGYDPPGGGIQFDGFDVTAGGPTGVLTLTNCKINGNTAPSTGGGVAVLFGSLNVSGSEFTNNQSSNASGGAISYDAGGSPGNRNLTVTNSTFANNKALNAVFGNGGGIASTGNATVTVENNTFTGNQAGTDGGAIFASASLASNAKSINKNKFSTNSAAQGGAVFNRIGTLTFNFNSVVGNSATDITSTGFKQSTGVISSIANDWWGCNTGPASAPCDRASGSLGPPVSVWLTLNHTATPNSILVNQSTTLQADFFTNSAGATIAAADLVALNGRAVTFNNAVLGTISGADPQIAAGKANATYTAGAVGGTGSADATVDHATVTATITISQPPTVNTNPTDQTVCDGGSVTFTASANGVPSPTVQWQVSTDGGGSFTNIPGATTTTLTFTATAAENGNQYRAVFTNTGGSATTTAATLTVNTAPTVTTNPSNVTTCEGATASFSAAANGSPAPSVQWQVSSGGPFTDIPGATSTTLSFTASTSQNGNTYRAVFTNSCGSATTTAATLTVNANTTATAVADQTVCQGGTAVFSTTAGGTGPFHYAWTVDGSAAGTDSASLSVDTTALSVGNHSISVTVSGTCGSATRTATLTVNANTTTTDPADASVCEGSTASFTTTASGTAPFTFVWKKGATVLNNGDLGGRVTITSAGNTSTLMISNVQPTDAGTYTVETTGACATASQSANLTVNSDPPTIVLNGNTISLWPPNHQYRTVNVTDLVASASDSCDPSVTINSVKIAQVTSDEAEDNPSGGDGTTLNDIVIAADCKSVQLRAERDANLNGRVYTITFVVVDSFGHVGTATAQVTVPVDQNGTAVNSGPQYTVTGTCP
jgi:CSLREA domain-containing protein